MLLLSRSLYSADKSELTYMRQCGWEFSPTGPALHWLLSEPDCTDPHSSVSGVALLSHFTAGETEAQGSERTL